MKGLRTKNRVVTMYKNEDWYCIKVVRTSGENTIEKYKSKIVANKRWAQLRDRYI